MDQVVSTTFASVDIFGGDFFRARSPAADGTSDRCECSFGG